MCKLRNKDCKGRTLCGRVKLCYTKPMLVKKIEVQNKSEMEQASECPLCLEPLEMDDANFFPCKCGYQVCRFCWHRIRTNESGLCPACRRLYPEDPANFKPLSSEDLLKLKNQKKKKELQKKQKIAENRSHLANLRVIQKNLIFVVGLPQGLNSDPDKMDKMLALFKPFGTVLKSMVNDRTKYAGTQGPSACAYITYQKTEDALKVLKNRPNFAFDGRSLKVSLGTTKYCSNFLKSVHCPKQDCMYLHEIAEDQASYTKEDIYAGKQVDYENSLIEKFLNKSFQHRNLPHDSKVSEINICNSKKDTSYNNLSDENSSLFSESKESDISQLSSNHPPSENSRNVDSVLHTSPDTSNKLRNNSNLDFTRETVSNHLFQKEKNHTIHIHNDVPSFQELSCTLQSQNTGLFEKEPKSIQKSESLLPDQNSSSSTSLFSSPQNACNSFVKSPPQLHSEDTSDTLSGNCDIFKSLDDDLGFDPCQEAINALQELLVSEAKEKKRICFHSLNKSPFNENKRRPVLPAHSVEVPHLQDSRHPLVQKDPPPGFIRNGLQPNQMYRPGIETVNSFPCQVPPVMLQNQFNMLRNSPPVQRFQHPGISPTSTMPYISDFSQYSSCERQGPIAQLPFNQRLPTLSPPQVFNTEHQVPSPSQHLLNRPFLRHPSETTIRSINATESPQFMYCSDPHNQGLRRFPNGSFSYFPGNL